MFVYARVHNELGFPPSVRIAFDLTQCISGNGEVAMKILEVGKLHTIIIFAIIHFFSAVIYRHA